MKAMASDIDRRYPTADAMLADLEEFRKNPDVDLDFSIEDLRRPDTDEPTQYIPAVQAVTPKREEPQEDEPVDEKKTQKMLLLAGGIALARGDRVRSVERHHGQLPKGACADGVHRAEPPRHDH